MLQSFFSLLSLGGQASSSSASSQAVSPVFPLDKVINDIQLKIFSFLNVEEFLQLRSTCKEFSKITFETWERNSQKLNLSILENYFRYKFKKEPHLEFLSFFKVNASRYRCLDFIGNPKFHSRLITHVPYEDFLLKVFQENSFLEAQEIRIAIPQVDISCEKQRRDELAEDLIGNILRACPNLTNVRLYFFPATAIKFLLKFCPKLKHLQLYYTFELDEECVKLLNDHTCLEKVSVSILDRTYALCVKINKLSYLTIKDYYEYTDADALDFIGKCSQLETLNLQNLNGRHKSLCPFMANLSSLTELKVTYCGGISGYIFSFLSKLPNLRKLTLEDWVFYEITEQHVASLLQWSNLEEFSVINCDSYTTSFLLKRIHLFANLKKLTIFTICDGDKFLNKLSKCKKLSYLKVRIYREADDTKGVTARLLKIAKSCSLKELDLSNPFTRLDLKLIETFRIKHPKIIITL